jgi:transposase
VFYGRGDPNTAGHTGFLMLEEAQQMAVDFARLLELIKRTLEAGCLNQVLTEIRKYGIPSKFTSPLKSRVSEPFCGMNALRPRKRRLSGEARRALGLLAVDRRGTTEALMLAGFTHRMLARLVHAGLATWYRGAVKAGDRTIEITYLMITDAGWRAIGGRNTKIHALADAKGRLIAILLTGGEAHDCPVAERLIRRAKPSKRMLGDKAYDSAELREDLKERGTKPVIPNRSNRKQPFSFQQISLQAPLAHRECLQQVEGLQAHGNALRQTGAELPGVCPPSRRSCMVDLMSLDPS